MRCTLILFTLGLALTACGNSETAASSNQQAVIDKAEADMVAAQAVAPDQANP